jgi:peroxiredoxin
MWIQRLIALSAIVLVAGFKLAATAAAQDLEPGDDFPPFSARDALSGEAIELADFRGKVVLIDFWATWCGPCVNELPNIKRVYSQYHDQGFEVVSISLDSDRRRFENFACGQHMRWHHVMQGGGWNTPLAKKYNIRSIPAMYLLDQEGKIISSSARGSRLESLVQRALAATPEALAREYVESRDAREEAEAEPQAPALDPAAVEAALSLIDGADEHIEIARDSIEVVKGRITTAKALADGLGRELPAPADQRGAQARCADLLAKLSLLRRELFVMGLPVPEGAAMPADPFAAEPRSSARAFVIAEKSVERAGIVIAEFEAAVGAAIADLARAEKAVGAVRAIAKSGYGDGSALLADAQAAAEQARAAGQRWSEPWRTRLAEADALIVDAATPITDAIGAIDSLDLQIAACRASAASVDAPDDDALRAVRDEFNSVREGIENGSHLLVTLGVLEAAPAFDLHDPFEGRLLRDRRNLADLDAQLEAAEMAAASLRQAASSVAARLSEYSARLHALRQEVETAGQSPRRMAEARDQFIALCDELIEFGDSAK